MKCYNFERESKTEMSKQPDKTEKVIQFVCGAIFGFFLTFPFAFLMSDSTLFVNFTIACLVALIFGILAVRFGDLFWERLIGWIPWL